MVSHLADRTPPANLKAFLPFLQGKRELGAAYYAA